MRNEKIIYPRSPGEECRWMKVEGRAHALGEA